MVSNGHIKGNNISPTGILTNYRLIPLGSTCVGDLGQINQHNATTNFVRTYYFVSEEAKMDEFNATLRQFREIDNSGMGQL